MSGSVVPAGGRKPTISLCMTASGPAKRVEAILEVVRPTVDEIVLGVDVAGDPALGDIGNDLVDLMLPFESLGQGGGLIGWIQHQCSCAWLLRLDDDEIPSAALLEALPGIVADPSLTHAFIPRRWLYPTVKRYLATHPWYPDYQLRLVRNVPGIWRFGGRVHDDAEVYGAHRLLAEPLYHADCILQSMEQRRSKAVRYERARPGHRTELFPVNAMYLPELCKGTDLRRVPRVDRRLAARLLTAPSLTRHTGATRACAPVTDLRSIRRYNADRNVSGGAYHAKLYVEEARHHLPVGTRCGLSVIVHNLGDEWWPAAHVGRPPIRLGCRWFDAVSGAQLSWEGRTGFPAAVGPGEESRVWLSFDTPIDAGAYWLEIDLVHEGVRWFGCGERHRVRLVSPDAVPVQVAGREFLAAYGRDGLDLRLCDLIEPRVGGRFIEAGANDGLTQSNTALLEQAYSWSGLLVEPVPRLAARCRNNRPGTIVEQVALVPGDFAGERVMMWDCGLMSLVAGAMEDQTAVREHLRIGSEWQDGLQSEQLSVPVATLSELIDRHGLGRVDLLVLDVEGYEAQVLRGLDLDHHGPTYLLIEARFRGDVEGVLGGRYSAIAELSDLDVLYRRDNEQARVRAEL